MSLKIIGVIGSSKEIPELNDTAQKLGELIMQNGYSVVCGGREGVMQAVCKGASIAKRADKKLQGQIIGILPGTEKTDGNPYLDIRIPTGVGWARNQIVVLSSDIIVVVGGSAGTLNEIAFAWSYKKTILAFENLNGWCAKVAGTQIDDTRTDKIISISSAEEALHVINEIFNA